MPNARCSVMLLKVNSLLSILCTLGRWKYYTNILGLQLDLFVGPFQRNILILRLTQIEKTHAIKIANHLFSIFLLLPIQINCDCHSIIARLCDVSLGKKRSETMTLNLNTTYPLLRRQNSCSTNILLLTWFLSCWSRSFIFSR